MSVQILIATGNPGKVREFREMLGDDRFQWSDLSQHPEIAAVEETGTTFRANACLKAAAYAKQLKTWALADDSGLEVDALDRKPGVTSARWAELHNRGKGDADNNTLLLEQMQAVPDDRRSARFVCVLALADPSGKIVLTAADAMEGKLLRTPRGRNGFGYDPLFEVEGMSQTSAELAAAEKHRVSHRGKALVRLRALMDRVFA
jgi:non-canonical purine NTP pyrophosphatase (RdgB/HAM1 family)